MVTAACFGLGLIIGIVLSAAIMFWLKPVLNEDDCGPEHIDVLPMPPRGVREQKAVKSAKASNPDRKLSSAEVVQLNGAFSHPRREDHHHHHLIQTTILPFPEAHQPAHEEAHHAMPEPSPAPEPSPEPTSYDVGGSGGADAGFSGGSDYGSGGSDFSGGGGGFDSGSSGGSSFE